MNTYILGDIHGENSRCVEILRLAEIVDDNGHWRAGLQDTFVQVGDVIDRGDEPVKAFMYLRGLQEEAQNEGGRIIRLLGNHELSYIGGTQISFRAEGYLLNNIIKADILNGKIVAAYLLDDWIVVHAGITKRIANGRPLNELVSDFNQKLVSAVTDEDFSDDIFLVGRSRGGSDEPGIFWADYDSDLLPEEESVVNQIIGHSPSHGTKAEIKWSPGGRIINVDIGMCTKYGGNKGVLAYKDGKFATMIF